MHFGKLNTGFPHQEYAKFAMYNIAKQVWPYLAG